MMKIDMLLCTLVHGTPDEIAAILDENVHFRQGDGTVHLGRAAVVALFARNETEVTHKVIDRAHNTVRVAMEVAGLPGSFSFLLCGRAVSGRLVEVWIEA
jgi:hypothetical protein